MKREMMMTTLNSTMVTRVTSSNPCRFFFFLPFPLPLPPSLSPSLTSPPSYSKLWGEEEEWTMFSLQLWEG